MTDSVEAPARAHRGFSIDLGLFVAGTGLGLFAVWLWHEGGQPSASTSLLHAVVGYSAILAVFLVRKWPVELAAVLTVIAPFYGFVYVAALAAQYRAMSLRPWRTTRMLAALSLASAIAVALVRPDPELSGTWKFLFVAALQGCAIVWGLFVRRRRFQAAELLAARNQRFPHLNDPYRNRSIQLSGTMQWQQVRRLIRIQAGLSTVTPEPTPTIEDIPQLVARANETGTPTTLVGGLPHEPPVTASRSTYRIVREALTSAGRHDGAVTVHMLGRAGESIEVEVTQRPPAGPARTPARRTFGRAFREAVELVEFQDGEVTHGPVDAGGWRLRAELPWRT